MRDHRTLVRQLRAKADSTTFPEEATSLRARADKLEAKYFPGQPGPGTDPFDRTEAARRAAADQAAEHLRRRAAYAAMMARLMAQRSVDPVVQGPYTAGNYSGTPVAGTTTFMSDGGVKVTFTWDPG